MESDKNAPVAPLGDAELSEVEGAVRGKTNPMTWISIKCGLYCGQFDTTSRKIIYRPCPRFAASIPCERIGRGIQEECLRCGKPMHSEWYAAKWYCDPCNFSEYNPRRADWNGSEQDLIAAAK